MVGKRYYKFSTLQNTQRCITLWPYFINFSEEPGLDKNSEDVAVFVAAKEKGIHRTIHSGEAGPAKCVKMVS